jgi:hypothetical protein
MPTMKIGIRSAVLCLLASLAACTKKDPVPVYPDAGLKIYSGGRLDSTCGFYIKSGAEISLRPKEMSFGKDGHQFNVVWTVQPKIESDLYHLKMTLDGVTSTKEVEFRGKPIVLLEQPFRVVMDNTPP